MENYVAAQLTVFFRSLVLGAVAALGYDLVREVRLRRRRSRALTHVLDAAYALAVGLGLLLFALGQGEGELRLYMLGAIGLGFVLYRVGLGALLRPVWALWGDILAAFAGLLWKPAGILLSCGKKLSIYIKKLFYFWRRYITIYEDNHGPVPLKGEKRRKGGSADGEKRKKNQKERRHRAAGAAPPHRRGGL